MKSYNEQEKSLLNSICQNADGKTRFGGEIVRQAFIDASIACLLVKEESEGWIFTSNTSDESSSESFSKVVWLLSFLEHCEQQNYIYCVETDDYGAIMFCTCANVALGVEKEGEKYSNTDEESIETNRNGTVWKDKNGRLKMKGIQCSPSFTARMKHYFASTMYPTSTLLELKGNDYKTFEELSLTKQLEDAKHNLRMAYISLFISLSMPVISIFISNRLGYTTIEKTQYEGITSLLDSLNVQNAKTTETFNVGTFQVIGKENIEVHRAQ